MLPRLEKLMAAVTAAKLAVQIVLSWIGSEARNWKPFIQNRVELIQQLTKPKSWKYCSSESS
ncbi:hypothetical protein T11_11710 [Trichinella zimbabwensis]|uniref:Uncharacterized protein n=1 Tax=Trichinella zimbabwensis TaxID=268475 RepID=A0A0V1HU14_9BILA|nr:hypothetical protein T11_11710 [Trichinella zimbabwensis]